MIYQNNAKPKKGLYNSVDIAQCDDIVIQSDFFQSKTKMT